MSPFEANTDDLVEALKTGIIDLSINVDEQYPAVPLEAFSDQPFLFLKKRNDIHQRGMQMCENVGFRPRIAMYLDQLLTSFYIAADGRGLALKDKTC